MAKEENKESRNFKDLLFEVILPKVDMISILLIAVSLMFKIFKLQGTSELFMISMSAYAGVCYLSAFKPSDLQSAFNKFIIKFGGISSAVLIIGTLFLILNLPGGKEMFTIGVPAFIIAFVLVLIKNTSAETDEYKSILKRHFKTFTIITVIYLVALYVV
ncbi:hypothetical protein [Fulvivirga lutimaris]|uniref:hypothetical protein n=1 Tax=Fulvivirga lutimaris TaxID=1819566 RepID=UPI0012BC5395|nr:hypothetical protein [Fulvivirga lutimaris]MTI39630.1 hypothetical protein [Fulvivirga lutimaris]